MADKPKEAKYPQMRFSDVFIVAKFQDYCDRKGIKYCKAADEAVREYLIKNDPTFVNDAGVIYDHSPERKIKKKGK